MHDVIDVRVPELEQRLADVVQRAHMRLFASQLRVNVADVVAQTLDVAGYQVEDRLYELMDNRRAFLAKLQHPNGNEIVVSVAPSTDESGQCVLRLLSYDYDTASQSELDERAHAVTRQLRDPVACTPTTRDASQVSPIATCSTSSVSARPGRR